MKRFLFLASLVAAFVAFPLAGAAGAQPASGLGSEWLSGAGQPSFEGATALGGEVILDEAETSGTIAPGTDSGTVTIVGENGSSLSCAVPPGLDLTPFLGGPVEATCELRAGVLTLTEIRSETGGQAEVKDDGSIEVQGPENDQGESAVESDQGEQGSPSVDDEQGDDDGATTADDEQGDNGGASAASGSDDRGSSRQDQEDGRDSGTDD